MSHVLERIRQETIFAKSASPAQLLANRANSLRSTGPKTGAGKKRSATNALHHGLTAARPVLPGENARHYRALVRQVRRRFNPQSALERDLCRRIAHLCWKLRRAPGAEAHLLRRKRERMFDSSAEYNQRSSESFRVPVRRYYPAGIIAEGFYRNEATAIERLQRYETRIERSLHQAIRTLIALQRTLQNEANFRDPSSCITSTQAGVCRPEAENGDATRSTTFDHQQARTNRATRNKRRRLPTR